MSGGSSRRARGRSGWCLLLTESWCEWVVLDRGTCRSRSMVNRGQIGALRARGVIHGHYGEDTYKLSSFRHSRNANVTGLFLFRFGGLETSP